MRGRRLGLIILLILACIAVLILAFTLYDGSGSPVATGVGVRINEVMTSNKGAVPDTNGNYPDWIELYNTTQSAVNISGFGLSDDKLSPAKWVFPSGTSIPAGGYLIVFCSGDSNDGPLHASFKLAATDDLVFYNAMGNPVDSLALKGVTSGYTLALNEAGVWEESAEPSPGYPNTQEGAAAYRASLSEGAEDIGVYINEFMASNKTTVATKGGKYTDWIELYNTTDQDVDLTGYGLSDNPSQPVKWKFPGGTAIPANGYLLVFCSGEDGLIEGELHAPFGLKAYGEYVVFSDKKGRILDQLPYGPMDMDKSMARVPDGVGEFQSTARPTPGYPNTDEGFAAFSLTSTLPNGDVYLSEAMSSNSQHLPQSDGSYPDWIELYNGSGTTMDLSGYGLSNNPNNPAKWRFPEGTQVAPGEYLVVLATGNGEPGAQKKNLECNFRLSADGDVVLLFDGNGALLDKLMVGRMLSGMSYGRTSDGLLYFETPTPGAANGNGVPGVSSTPGFETLPGVYDAPLDVVLTAGGGETIHYTTDCTTPTKSSPAYTGPLSVSKNTVIRAIAVKEGFATGYSISGTFLFTSDGVDHALPIATLVTDPDNLWAKDTGIYATGEKFDPDLPTYGEVLTSAQYYQSKFLSEEAAKAWERPGSFAIFGEDKRQAFSQNIDMRIAGSYGRGRAQKAFNLTARSEYGNSRMEYPFFDNRAFPSYKALTLRAGAQDQNRSKIRDELALGLLEGTDVRFLYQAHKPYVLYLNGEYWGVYFLKEKRNRFFVADHEGVADADTMDIVKGSGGEPGKVAMVSHGSNEQWLEIRQYFSTHDLSVQSNFDHVSSQIDLDSFMDYMICEIYVGNTDTFNMQYYKLPGGKWTWIYYDFCWGFGNADHRTLSGRRGAKPAGSGLLNALLKNPAWKDAFIRRFAEILDTVYAPDRVNAMIDELYAAVEPEIKREREKFNQSTFRGEKQPAENLGTYEGFQRNITALHTFANNRPAAIKSQIKEEFGLSDSDMREVFGE